MSYLDTILELLGYIFIVIGLFASIYEAYKRWNNIDRLTWEDVDKATRKIINKISEDEYYPEVIVTIGRGGAIVGALISGNLPAPSGYKNQNIPMLGLDRFYEWENGNRIEVGNKMVDFNPLFERKVLLVAGDVITGGTMRYFSEKITNASAKDLRTVALLKNKTATYNPDYFGREIPSDFASPWMYKGYDYKRDSRTPSTLQKKSFFNRLLKK